MRRTLPLLLGLCLAWAPSASADQVLVQIDGVVFFNGFTSDPLDGIGLGFGGTLSFVVDTDGAVDSATLPRRAYPIVTSSVQYQIGSVQMAAELPYPDGATPYFVVRDDEGNLDGFHIGLDVDSTDNLALDQIGAMGDGVSVGWTTTYDSSLIDTLDITAILDAYGSAGLLSYGLFLDDGPLTKMGLLYQKVVLTAVADVNAWTDVGSALAGAAGDPLLEGTGDLTDGSPTTLNLTNAAPSASALLFVALSSTPTAFKGGTLVPVPWTSAFLRTTSGGGGFPIPFAWPAGFPSGTEVFVQWAITDAGAPNGVALSNALRGDVP